jgi:hypothetical protein
MPLRSGWEFGRANLDIGIDDRYRVRNIMVIAHRLFDFN